MERTLSAEDRIKRAEDIYYKRRNFNESRQTTVNLNPKREYKLFKKLIFQILISLGIYLVIFNMQSNTDSFSIDSINYIKNNVINYDEDFGKWIKNSKNYIENLFSKFQKEQPKTNDNTQNAFTEEILSASENQEEEKQEGKKQEETLAEDVSSISQMEQDAKYIKENYSLIKPVVGTITSRFGIRNPTTQTVPKYHTGIDIAVNEGTVYVSAMDGTVEEVSSVGDYRKSCKNNKW